MAFSPYSSSDALVYEDIDEEKLIEAARLGNNYAVEYLIAKYRCLVLGKVNTYFLIGADRDDIIQEGLIGLFKAIRNYDKDKLTSFKSFAEICITRQIITAIKSATRQKHMPLNSYISLNKPVYEEGSEKTLLDMMDCGRIVDPLEVYISREVVDSMESKILEVLTDLELEILNHYVEGKSYEEISKDTNRETKSIDNALQRVKKKLEKCFNIV